MKVNPMKPVSRVMCGPELADGLRQAVRSAWVGGAPSERQGNGRPGSPVRWLVYWSPIAERLGAPVPPPRFSSRYEAEAVAMLWANPRLAHAARVERER